MMLQKVFEGYKKEAIQTFVDIGVVIEQKEATVQNLLKTEVSDKDLRTVHSPVYKVKSILRPIVYDDCLPLAMGGDKVSYLPGNVVLLLNIEDVYVFIVGSLPWLSLDKIGLSLDEDVAAGTRIISGGKLAKFMVYSDDSFGFIFPIGEYRGYVSIGKFSDSIKDRVLFSVGRDDIGDVFVVRPNGVWYSDIDEFQMYTDFAHFDTNSIKISAFGSGGNIIVDVENYFRLSLGAKSETVWYMNEHLLDFYYQDGKIHMQVDGSQKGIIDIDLSDVIKISVDANDNKRIITLDVNEKTVVDIDEDEVRVYEDKGDIQPSVRAEDLKSELDKLYQFLVAFVSIFNAHMHIGNIGIPTSSPFTQSRNPDSFTEKWFSKKLKIQ